VGDFLFLFFLLFAVAFPQLFSLLKKIGIEVAFFGEEKDIMFFVHHVENIMKTRSENKDTNVKNSFIFF
jgi:hypothetical protein